MAIITKTLTADDPQVTWTMSGPGTTVSGISLVDNGDGTATLTWDSANVLDHVDTTITFRATNSSGVFSEVTEQLVSYHMPTIVQDISVKGLTLTHETLTNTGAIPTPGSYQNSIYVPELTNNTANYVCVRRLVARSVNPNPNFNWLITYADPNDPTTQHAITTTVSTTDITDDTFIITYEGFLGAPPPFSIATFLDATVTVVDTNNPYGAQLGVDLQASISFQFVAKSPSGGGFLG